MQTTNHSTMDRDATNPLLPPPELSPVEQEVLHEYERLADNMKKVRAVRKGDEEEREES